MNVMHVSLIIALVLALAAGPASADTGHVHGSSKGPATMGGPGKPADAKRVVRIEARDRDYSVRQIQVRPGETVRFVVTNRSSIRHEFAIASREEHVEHRAMMVKHPDMVHDEANVVTVEPGETREIVWTFGTDRNALKTLEFACNIPGHAEQGMQGTFRGM